MANTNNIKPNWVRTTAVDLLKLTGFSVPVFSILVYAADSKLNDKYATDADLEVLTSLVLSNAEAIEHQVESNQELALITTELQINIFEREVAEMEANRDTWQPYDRTAYNDKKRLLEDLEAKRSRLVREQ